MGIDYHRKSERLNSILKRRVISAPIGEEQPTSAEILAGLLEEAQNIERGEPIQYQSPRKSAVVDAIMEKFRKQSFGQ